MNADKKASGSELTKAGFLIGVFGVHLRQDSLGSQRTGVIGKPETAD
jgi:hypothetical protein